jgi:hypothetical protein
MSISQQEFAAALAKGTGRAMILLRQAAGTEDFKAALIHACVCNLSYDPQCEHERSAYLARLIQATGDRAAIFAALAARLRASAGDDVDIPQLFAVLTRLAAPHGDAEKSLLRQAFRHLPAEEQSDCMEAFVRLDGLSAVIECVELLGDRLAEEGWWAGGLLEALKERDGSSAGSVLQSAGAEHPQLGALLAQLGAQERSRAPVSEPDEPYDFAEIRSALLRGERPGGAWLRRLSEREWRALAEDFGLQTDEARTVPYLRLFARRRFPGDPQQLMRWAENSNARVSWAGAHALGRMRDPLVRQMAIERLRDGDPSGARMLLSNYEPGDLATIDPLLRDATDDDEAHDLGFSILDIVKANDVPPEESRAALVLLYQRDPCSMCRGEAVSRLVEAGQVPAWMAEECRFDADPDTARLFTC